MVTLQVQKQRLEQLYVGRYQRAHQRRLQEAEQRFGSPLTDAQWMRVHNLALVDALIRPDEFFRIMSRVPPYYEGVAGPSRQEAGPSRQEAGPSRVEEVANNSPTQPEGRRGCRCSIM